MPFLVFLVYGGRQKFLCHLRFSGEGGTDLDIKTGLMTGGVEAAEDEVEQEGRRI